MIEVSKVLTEKDNDIYSFLEWFIQSELNKYDEYRNYTCEGSCLLLCKHLPNTWQSLLITNDFHAIVLVDKLFWIDIYVGIIVNSDFSEYEKLSNFDLRRYNNQYPDRFANKHIFQVSKVETIKLASFNLKDILKKA